MKTHAQHTVNENSTNRTNKAANYSSNNIGLLLPYWVKLVSVWS